MKRFVFLLLCFGFLLVPFSLAAPSFSMADSFTSGSVLIEGTCSEPGVSSVPLQVVFGGFTVWVGEADIVLDSFETSFTPGDEGTYTVYGSCGGSSSHEFCYGPSCSAPVAAPSSGGSSGGGGGGGSSCRSDWVCGGWSFCNASLEQSRLCSDSNDCRFATSEPELVRSCNTCETSWRCDSWSACANGVQTRTCTDLHYCGSNFDRPVEQRSCTSSTVGTTASSTGSGGFGGFSETSGNDSFFSSYGLYILLVFLLLVLLIAGIIFARKYKASHRPAANYSQLVDWISREREMGIGDEQIRQTLGSRTGWRQEEINRALSGSSSV